MEFKGTKGEWKKTRGGHIISGSSIVCQLFDKKELDFNDYEINEANAKLIASAPELLEALKTALEQLKGIDDVLNHENLSVVGWHLNGYYEPIENFFNDTDCNAIEIAEQAIKKATE